MILQKENVHHLHQHAILQKTKTAKPPPKKRDRDGHDDDRHYKVIKIIHKNKIIVRDYDDSERELLIIGDRNTCPIQTDSVTLSGKINPKGIRLLADFYPCRVNDGSVTLNMPDTTKYKIGSIAY